MRLYLTSVEVDGRTTFDSTLNSIATWEISPNGLNQARFTIMVESITFRSPVKGTYTLSEFRRLSGWVLTKRYDMTLRFTGPNRGEFDLKVHQMDGYQSQNRSGKIEDLFSRR